jgi:predicted RNA binding protein YcfA (HicA-like mRNA interferase family)
MNRRRLLRRLSSGAVHNVAFADFADLVEAFGYRLVRVRGSHHIFEHPAVPELLNVQDRRGEAKPYQIREFLQYVEQYNFHMEDE